MDTSDKGGPIVDIEGDGLVDMVHVKLVRGIKKKEAISIRRFTVLSGSFASQNPIELGFEGAPAAADFDGFNAAFGNVFEVGGAGNFKVFTGLFGGINDALAVFTIKSAEMAVEAAVKAAASIRFFSPIFTASALHDMIIYHKYHLVIKN